MSNKPNPSNGYLHEHASIILDSFRHWTGRVLVAPTGDIKEDAKALYTAPFVVVSHGVEEDPVFNYGNETALKLFELEWCDFTRMPSRKSAEPVNREERTRILTEVEDKGFCEDYSGIRISSSGHRFTIENAIVWNLLDSKGAYCGQAATFGIWKSI